jgi:hypothetical protein
MRVSGLNTTGFFSLKNYPITLNQKLLTSVIIATHVYTNDLLDLREYLKGEN